MSDGAPGFKDVALSAISDFVREARERGVTPMPEDLLDRLANAVVAATELGASPTELGHALHRGLYSSPTVDPEARDQ